MAIYVGINGVPKKASTLYIGVNGIAKEVSTVYCGINGEVKGAYTGLKPGMSIFTSSGIFTAPKGAKELQVFCVGGGSALGWDGGGGGYTKTNNIAVNSEDQINISVGNGGYRSAGGQTIVNGVVADGGTLYRTVGGYDVFTTYSGYHGGSGGGAYGSSSTMMPGNGGSDGGNGGSGGFYYNGSPCYKPGGVGQGTTTRAFGESDGTLYAGGGGALNVYGSQIASGGAGGGGNGGASSYLSLWANPCNGQPNTGGGGGGSKGRDTDLSMPYTYGGSGIAIIRWG